MPKMIEKVERLVTEINKIHEQYAKDYFETGKVEKVNLSRTFSKVPTEYILAYRLHLHEAINDYLYKADVKDINFYYRVKTSESILDKIDYHRKRETTYPVNTILNDIFGVRVLLDSHDVNAILNKIDDWKDNSKLSNWYLKDADGYIGVHAYFAPNGNFPWELQIWDENDAKQNIESHKQTLASK